MRGLGLNDEEAEMIREVLRRHVEVTEARIFGSRAAKGTAQAQSDIDLALSGKISFSVLATISGELDELPLPYRFDVASYDAIRHQPLRQHIDRVGQRIYASGNCSIAPV
jgi:predicted nucleotidyltransferase